MKAISYNLLAWAILPFMDTIAKYLSSELSFFQITWARYFFTVFFTLPFMFFFFRKNLTWSTQPKLQIFRGLTLFFANVLFFYSISVISMAKALTLAFVAPLITTALSPIFLGEKVGFRRWSAVIIGFVGGAEMLGGLISGVTTCCVLMAIFQSNAGGAWDNAKKMIESDGRKGSDAHKAAVVGDTVGDPFKDTSGPSLNILLKLMSVVALVIAPSISFDSNKISDNYSFEKTIKKDQINLKDFNRDVFVSNKNLETGYNSENIFQFKR